MHILFKKTQIQKHIAMVLRKHKRAKTDLSMRLLKAFGVTMLAFLLSMTLMAPFSTSVSALFSTPEKNDFTITDFYNIVADSRAVSHLDDNIVIVNIDRSDRNEIADIISVATLSGARAIGLDVMFEDEREGDEPLLEAIREAPVIVQPLAMKQTSDADTFAVRAASYFYTVPGATESHYGAASMPSRYERSTVREMRTFFPADSGDPIPSFAVALARATDPEAAKKLEARGNELEMINYHSRRFRTIEPDELIDRAEELNGRVVLIGALNEIGDLHQTPVNSSMPGVMIHAHSLATILDGAYMKAVPKSANMLIGCILCFIIVLTHISLSVGVKGLIIRIMQVIFVWIAVQIGYWFFVEHDIIIDFSYSLLMLAFGLFACDIWNGVISIGTSAVNRLRNHERGVLRRHPVSAGNSENPNQTK